MKRIYIIGIILIALLFVGWLISFLFSGSLSWISGGLSASSSKIGVAHDYIPKSSGREVPQGLKEYYNPDYKISLLYPDTLTAREIPEARGAMTATFEYDDKKTVNGFQVFMVPFTQPQITEERFKQDVPSGVREKLQNISIDGATGASFYSKDALLGDTAEVWFTHGGYLYEVNTFKELDTWLADIMKTWKFTL